MDKEFTVPRRNEHTLLLTKIRTRQLQPELMDQPGLEKNRHQHALRDLARLNWWSRSVNVLWPEIHKLANTLNRPVRVLDIATGAGDIPIQLWHKGDSTGIKLDISACDISPTALEFAQHRSEQTGAQVTFFRFDIFRDVYPQDYDVIISSLFLHHLDSDAASSFLHDCGQAAQKLLLINDLRRSWRNLLLVQTMTRLLSPSYIVHGDGPMSVRAAFTIPEVLKMAEDSGLAGCRITQKWPFRFLLSWQKS